jgi:hypothetical protein
MLVAMRRWRTWADRKSRTTQLAIVGMAVIVVAVGFRVVDDDDQSGTEDHAAIDLRFAILTLSVPALPYRGYR